MGDLWPGCEAYLRLMSVLHRPTIEIRTMSERDVAAFYLRWNEARETTWDRYWRETRQREVEERRDWE